MWPFGRSSMICLLHSCLDPSLTYVRLKMPKIVRLKHFCSVRSILLFPERKAPIFVRSLEIIYLIVRILLDRFFFNFLKSFSFKLGTIFITPSCTEVSSFLCERDIFFIVCRSLKKFVQKSPVEVSVLSLFLNVSFKWSVRSFGIALA